MAKNVKNIMFDYKKLPDGTPGKPEEFIMLHTQYIIMTRELLLRCQRLSRLKITLLVAERKTNFMCRLQIKTTHSVKEYTSWKKRFQSFTDKAKFCLHQKRLGNPSSHYQTLT